MNPSALVIGAAAACWSATACAQQPAPAPQAPSFVDALKKYKEVDLSVPESPAFAILGIAPSAVQRPGTVRELAGGLLKGLDSKGKPRTGLAFDFAPLPLAAPQEIVGGRRYEQRPLVQILTRTTISLATSDAAGGGSQQAWGIRMGLLDQGDPGLYSKELMSCIDGSVVIPPPPPAANVNPLPAESNEAIRQAIAQCDPGKRIALWAKPALYAGFGQSWYSASGALSDRSPAARAFWATYSVGRDLRGLRSLLLVHAERKSDDRTPGAADAAKLLRQDTTGLAARLRVGAEKWHAFGEFGAKRVKLEGVPKSNVRHLALGAELRVKDDIWLQLGRTTEHGVRDGTNHRQVTAGLRLGSDPFLPAPGGGN